MKDEFVLALGRVVAQHADDVVDAGGREVAVGLPDEWAVAAEAVGGCEFAGAYYRRQGGVIWCV